MHLSNYLFSFLAQTRSFVNKQFLSIEDPVQRAMKADTASLIELRVDKEVITTRTTLNAVQSKAFSKK